MTAPVRVTSQPLSARDRPLARCRAWPADAPLLALLSSGSGRSRWSRRSLVAAPVSSESIRDPQRALARLGTIMGEAPDPGVTPFTSGWVLVLGSELVRAIEPSARALPADGPPAPDDRRWPALILQRVEPGPTPIGPAPGRRFALHLRDPSANRASYERAVARTIELIRAGDVFQANIAHRLTGDLVGLPRAFALELIERSRPWFGAVIEEPQTGLAVASASPELFLHFDPVSRRVTTRPIKGTRPGDASPGELLGAPKDRAELAMIVDLMRNDIGRVCEYSSVRVDEPRVIESHAGAPGAARGVHHAVATVSGTMRSGASLLDLIRATFPPGSVTGAPKVRALQIIDGLEPVRRGPHFGAIGFLCDSGELTLSVAIRTAAITPSGRSGRSCVDFSVVAGIVADSDPASEWSETLQKAEAFLMSASRPKAAGV